MERDEPIPAKPFLQKSHDPHLDYLHLARFPEGNK